MKNSLIGPLLTEQNRKVIERAINALINLRITVTGGGSSSVSRSASGENSHSVSIDIQPVVNACIENAGIRPQVTTATLSASADYTIALADAEQMHVVTLNGANVDITNLYLSGHAPGRKARLMVYFGGSGASVNNLESRGWIWPQFQGLSVNPPEGANGKYVVYDFTCTTSADSGVIALGYYGNA